MVPELYALVVVVPAAVAAVAAPFCLNARVNTVVVVFAVAVVVAFAVDSLSLVLETEIAALVVIDVGSEAASVSIHSD